MVQRPLGPPDTTRYGHEPTWNRCGFLLFEGGGSIGIRRRPFWGQAYRNGFCGWFGGANRRSPSGAIAEGTATDAQFLAAKQYASKAISTLGYVAQVVAPPQGFGLVEFGAANKILRFAVSALNVPAAHNLHLMGGICLKRPLYLLQAARVRAALKTVRGFNEMESCLLQTSLDAGHLFDLNTPSTVPPGWDAPAFCANLAKAVRGKLVGCPQKARHDYANFSPPRVTVETVTGGGSLSKLWYMRILQTEIQIHGLAL